ncbi:coatomer zeta subunit [Cryptococcus deuterogattii 99/473]|uniref:Coatomer subunit zeta n=1 Tax=Cryptococcus deuterogattii Ram5 TaxID=1296110 RepID=A0A0D0V2H1_9TREE|nr:coatomer zeta subunit [Cryptococcus deuterogattii LA55]KIR39105.1 coatomer zeta subunit [Cryptococcus deuterogattii Ram5]KIR94527.1 coatomer zeta subunit [Cryptococcus deuterogattii CBS 10090]KIY54203.1 coatomer zeta subunit [Cryptococcus deuterogattii 99/473]
MSSFYGFSPKPKGSNLSLYTVTALLILDSEGQRVFAKYYNPPHQTVPGTGIPAELGVGAGGPGMGGLLGFKEQKAFEKSVFDKIRRGAGEIYPLPPHIILTRSVVDLTFIIVGPLSSTNELMLNQTLSAFFDAVNLLLRGAVEKRNVLESLDLVLLAADETVDDGIILETDAAAIASRVSRPRPDTTDIVINEQTLMNAYTSLRDRVSQKIQQF